MYFPTGPQVPGLRGHHQAMQMHVCNHRERGSTPPEPEEQEFQIALDMVIPKPRAQFWAGQEYRALGWLTFYHHHGPE